MLYQNIILVNADPIKNAGNIKNYFLENCEGFTAFHFYPGYSIEFCYFEKYKKGKLIKRENFSFYKGSNYLIKSFLQYITFLYVALRYAERGSELITNAPIFCCANFILRWTKSINFNLWLGDYYPQSSIVMNFYKFIVDYYNKNLSQVIYLTPPLKKVYYDKNLCKGDGKIINLGIKKIGKKNRKTNAKKSVIGFLGVIRKQQGLELVFDYIKDYGDARLEIVGDGYHASYYKKLAKRLSISNRVKFYGFVEDLGKVIERWDIGIAPYENSEGNLSKYCEPTKIKDYLSFGLPVITTKTTYFSEEIKNQSAGEVIEENPSSLSDAINEINSNYEKYTEGVEELLKKYEYKKWYDERFKFLR